MLLALQAASRDLTLANQRTPCRPVLKSLSPLLQNGLHVFRRLNAAMTLPRALAAAIPSQQLASLGHQLLALVKMLNPPCEKHLQIIGMQRTV